MKILAIDTSGQQAGAAIIAGDFAHNYITVGEILLNARTGEKSWTHSEILMPGIDRLFALTGLKPGDMDYIAYTSGPGSFTGLRIGASVALGMAKALNRTWVAVPSLDALAYNVLGVGNAGLVVPMFDARRGQIYSAIYSRSEQGRISLLTEYMAMHVKEILEILGDFVSQGIAGQARNDESIIFLGDGADAYSQEIKEIYPNALITPSNNNRLRAASAGVWAMEKITDGYQFAEKVDIIYVRSPQAVREAK